MAEVSDSGGAAQGQSLDNAGPAAPPRQNGELVFEAPWESRLFGLTMVLCEEGRIRWDDFRRELIEQIARFDRQASANPEFHYYRHWQRALEIMVDRSGLCSQGSMRSRAQQLSERPHGH